MSAQIRRSWLIVPMSKAEQIAQAPRSGADVIALDLVEFVPEEDKPAARERAQAAIRTAHAGGAEVFAQVDPELFVAPTGPCAGGKTAGRAGVLRTGVPSTGPL